METTTTRTHDVIRAMLDAALLTGIAERQNEWKGYWSRWGGSGYVKLTNGRGWDTEEMAADYVTFFEAAPDIVRQLLNEIEALKAGS